MSADNAAPAERQPPKKRRRPWPLVRRAPAVADRPATATNDGSAAAQPGRERGLMSLITKLTAIVVLISSIVTLVYKLWPDPEPVQKADMATPRVESGLTFRQYLERVDEEPGNLEDELLNRKGALIQFTVEVTGYRGDNLRLRWEVIDLGTHNQVVKSDAITITPGADTDRLGPRPVFAPFPKGGGPFNVHGELFAPDGVSLADAEKEFERG